MSSVPFPGFPERMTYLPLPASFFGALLRDIDDLAEMKLTLHCLRLLQQQRQRRNRHRRQRLGQRGNERNRRHWRWSCGCYGLSWCGRQREHCRCGEFRGGLGRLEYGG